MRLKVQVEWQGQPWRKRVQIRNLAIVDAIFGILLALLYICKISFPAIEPEFPAFTSADKINNSLALIFLTFANILQTLHSLRLCFIISKKENRDPANCFEVSKTWFDFSEFSFLFMIVKCIITISYVIKVAAYPWVVILMVITTPECIFKLYMLYNVYGFMKDLKASLKYMPKFNFYPVISSSSRIQLMENLNNFNDNLGYDANDKIVDADINANTQLLV